MTNRIAIAPSLLAGDFGNLEASARKAEASGGDFLHLDIMDAHFVPNLSMGPDVVKMAKRCVKIPLYVHLMMTRPDAYLQTFCEAGAAILAIHIEASCDVPAALRRIRALGARPGIALNPETPVQALAPVLDLVDDVLFMTVHPGFGGQSFMPEALPKIRVLRAHFLKAAGGKKSAAPCPDIAVDGGIDLETVRLAAAAGANVMIAGHSLYSAADMTAAIALLRERAESSFT